MVKRLAPMEITAVHCEGYEFELFSCCDEPGTCVYSWFCGPCMAGDIQQAIHPEVGWSRACVMTMCCPALYVAEPMDKFQKKFHFEERGCVDKFIIDLAVICFCMPCELTREWRQVKNYNDWVADGGLAQPEENKGVYADQGGQPMPDGNTEMPPTGYGQPSAPNPYAPAGSNPSAPNPYNQPPPNQYNQPPPNQYNQAPPNQYGQPPNPYGQPPNPYQNQQPVQVNQQQPYGQVNQQQPYNSGEGEGTH